MFTGYKGAAKRLDDIDLPKLGARIGVGEDKVHAVLDVESRGSGFDDQGRLAMLFEPHIFWKELGEGKQRELAVAKGLAYPKWRKGNYPKDSYPRLIEAMAINQTAALKSASWGLAQIMGFNHLTVGYANVEDMVTAFAADEERQLEAMIEFIIKKGIAEPLRKGDWLRFATVYNGDGQAEDYATRLQQRFHVWSKIKDTPWDPKTFPPMPIPDLERPAPRPVPIDKPDVFLPEPEKAPPSKGVAAIILGLAMAAIAAFAAWMTGGTP
jgi:hypothetical protein